MKKGKRIKKLNDDWGFLMIVVVWLLSKIFDL